MTISATLLSSKLKSLSDLAQIIDLEKQAGKVVVHAHGVFDLVHPGHLRHLSVARQHGDILVVTITADKHVNKGPDRPVFSEKLRAEFLSALELIDYVAINDNPTAVEAILELKPSIYIKGNDYQVAAEDITGGISKEAAAVNSVGGKIVFTDDITFSSSHLLNSHFDLLSTEAEEHLKAFRESYSVNSILSEIDKIESMKILIIGDVIIDEYVFCRVLGRSSKATSLNSQYISEEAHAGGILAIANHLAELMNIYFE